MQGQPDRAEAILEGVEATAGEFGLFAEEMDPATDAILATRHSCSAMPST